MYNTVGETAGVTQDVGSDPTVGVFPSDSSAAGAGAGAVIGVDGAPGKEMVGKEEDLTCTYCGRELEEEFVELSVGEEEQVAVREPDVKFDKFDLSEMSFMEDEDEDEDMDGEPYNGLMDSEEDVHGGGAEHSHGALPPRSS